MSDPTTLSSSDRRSVDPSSSPINEITNPFATPTNKNPSTSASILSQQILAKEIPNTQPDDLLSLLGKVHPTRPKQELLFLAMRLKGKTEAIWESIQHSYDPAFIEPLSHLRFLLKSKRLSEEVQSSILSFAFHLVETTSTKNNPSSPFYDSTNAQQLLGQLIYLVDQNPEAACACLSKDHVDALSAALIQEAFETQLELARQRLNTHYEAHLNTQLQPATTARQNLLTNEITKLLMTSYGMINYGIIDLLFGAFSIDSKHPMNHHINLCYTLKNLQTSVELRQQFQQITAPSSPDLLINDVIRAMLQLSPKAVITDLDAKKVALIALLSHLRQNNDGSCFATSLAIELLSSRLDLCLKDFIELLKNSKLTRTIHGVKRDIPFIKRIRDECLDQEITLTKDGYLIIDGERKSPLWIAPGIQSVCKTIGISNPQQAVQIILSGLTTKKTPRSVSTLTLSTYTLLRHLCNYALRSSPDKEQLLNPLFEQVCFTFSSQTANPLLKTWENTIASMAESQEKGIIKNNIMRAIIQAFNYKLSRLKIAPNLFITRSLEQIITALMENMSLQYDPSIMETISSTHLPAFKEGGFVLYYQSERIDTPKKFVNFMASILFSIYQKLIKNAPLHLLGKLTHIFNLFRYYIISEEFLIHTLERYHPSNRALYPQFPYEKLNFTPWISKTGNNSKSVLEVYLENERVVDSEHLLTENAEQRLAKIIRLGQQLSVKEKEEYLHNPYKLDQFRIPGRHSSSLMLGHPSLVKAWSQSIPPEEWIKEYILKPGREIAFGRMDSLTERNLLEKMEKEIIPTFLNKSHLLNFRALIARIPKALSIVEYRQALINIFPQIDPNCSPMLDRIKREIDSTIYQSLAPFLKERLQGTLIHFADTNWYNDTHDLHFCFIVNPGTGNLEIWEGFDNQEKLIALDQNYWLNGQEWDIFKLPKDNR